MLLDLRSRFTKLLTFEKLCRRHSDRWTRIVRAILITLNSCRLWKICITILISMMPSPCWHGMYLFIYECIHVYIFVYICMNACVYIHACVCIYIFICIYLKEYIHLKVCVACIDIGLKVYSIVYIYINIYVCTYIYVYMYVCVCIYDYIYMYLYI